MHDKLSVGIAGLSIDPDKWKMARAVAEAIQRSNDIALLCWYAANSTRSGSVEVNGHNLTVMPIGSLSDRNGKRPDIIIDYTTPEASIPNAQQYWDTGIPFVMGTTGADRDSLVKVVQSTGNIAVIAPNMAREIVALQAILQYALRFPYLFRGHTLEIVESHQSWKKDTSGTAKAIKAIFEQMGADAGIWIRMIRNPSEQRGIWVPEEHLGGHAYHTYTLRKPDGSIAMSFSHNVNGRWVYADGTIAAVRFLAARLSDSASRWKTYSMIDVLGNSGD